MFKKYLTAFVVVITVLSIPAQVFRVKIWGGRIEDVLVLEEGTGPGQIKGLQDTPHNLQPNAIDVDMNRNLYLHDPFNTRIQVFSSNGNFLREIKTNGLIEDSLASGAIQGHNIACDNGCNIYLIGSTWGHDNGLYLRLVKYSYNDEQLPQTIVIDNFKLPGNWVPTPGINADYQGNLYIYFRPAIDEWEKPITWQEAVARIYLYENGARLKTHFEVQKVQRDEIPPQIVQKEDSLVRIVFLRNGYLHLTNILEIISGVLKDSIKEPPELTSSVALIGFDLNLNIYLLEKDHWVYKTSEIAAAGTFITILHRYKIEKGQLIETGRVYLDFLKGLSEKEREKVATEFEKRYVVAGNGEVYFLHGTIDKLYISKIIFDEFNDKK